MRSLGLDWWVLGRRNFNDVLFVLLKLAEIVVEGFFLQHCLLVEESLGEGVVLALDALRFLLADDQVETRGYETRPRH